MTDYGAIFREFRLNRQLSLQDVAGEELSVAQLSRFECGKSDLSLTKFLQALERLNITADQFMDRVNHYKRVEQIALMSQMAKYHYQKDITGLSRMAETERAKLAEHPDNRRALLNEILFRGMIAELDENKPLTTEDLAVISDHLFCTERWDIDELILVGNLYRFYETDLMCRMIDAVVARQHFYQDIATHKNLVEVTLLNVMETLVERGELERASHYDKLVQPLITNERKAYHRLFYLYVKGFLKQAQGDETGHADMAHAIQAFEWIGARHHVQTYRDHYNRFVKNP